MNAAKRKSLARVTLMLSIQLIGILLILGLNQSLSSVSDPITGLFMLAWFLGYFETHQKSTYLDEGKDHFPKVWYYAYELWLTFGVLFVAYDHCKVSTRSPLNAVMTCLGFSVFVVGAAIFRVSRNRLKSFYSSQLIVHKDHRLVTNGIYRYIRHPMYLGGILIHISFPLVFSSIYGLVYFLLILLFVRVTIRIEEVMLTDSFGDEYKEYIAKTKRMIPFIY
jgi:protein-S-isoprenylcysteine O-methyltransferase Ste14